MAGYIRQSVANIVNGSKITAPPLNAEFNKIQDAFNSSTGHTHDGSTGNSQPIPLSTSVVGYLPVVNGGVGGKNNTTATADPTTADDATQGYAPGSIWINATTGYTHMCLFNTENAANWVTITAISNTNIIAPKATNTVDIGTSTFQFKDIHIDGTGYIDAVMGETVSTTGDITVGGNIVVTGTTTLGDISTPNIDIDGGSIDGTPIGAGTASTGAFAGLTATGNVTFSGATIADLGTVTTADIDGGSIDSVTLGTNSAVTEAQIDNINIDGNAITSTDTNGNISITPDGSGTVNVTKANVTGGSIDGTTVGATTASTGDFTTLTASTSITGDLTGDVTGDLTGDVYASNGTSKVLESGTDGTNASFTGSVTGNLSGNVSSTGSSTFDTLNIGSALTFNAGATATISNLVTPTNAGDAANKGYVDTAVSNLVDSAPGALDTLNELAAALGDDANFSTNVTASIAEKLPLAGGVMTGNINMTDATNAQHSIVGLADPATAQGAATKAYADTKLPLTGGTLTGTLSMNTSKITNLGTPVLGTDASTKQYVDDTLNYGIAASTSASAALISASAASGSANSASQSEATVTSLYDSFDDRYLGAKSSVPNSDNDGDALLVGALYFDTTSNAMKVYTGTGGWVETGSTVNGILDKFRYVSTASQTTFSGSDANGNTLAYDPSAVDVYLSGLRLVSGTDYTATTGTSIQLTTAPDTGSTLEIVAFGNVVVNDPQEITASQLDLKVIAETKAVLATDVFVYDTSKDSDGGAWRNRTQGTSWYNEPLNTSDRGATKKFPAVAVIVAENNYFYIYDGDDPSMPLWFRLGAANYFAQDGYAFDIKSITAKDGKIFVGLYQTDSNEPGNYGGIIVYDFVADTSEKYAGKGLGSNRGVKNGVRVTNWGGYLAFIQNENKLVNGWVNDIAVTVLPNAPINPDTGLPVPTIAVATDGGVSVIKDDGSIVDLTDPVTPYVTFVSFTDENRLVFSADSSNLGKHIQLVDIPNADTAYVYNSQPSYVYTTHDGSLTSNSFQKPITPELGQYRTKALVTTSEGIAVSNTGGGFGQGTLNNTGYNTVNYITSTYNTGWMPGDIKLATLMDTTAETIVAPELVANGGFSPGNGIELITNGTFNTDVSNWGEAQYVQSFRTDGTNYPSLPVGCIYIETNSAGSGVDQSFPTVVGQVYEVNFDLIYSSTTNVQGQMAVVFISNSSGTAGAVANHKVYALGSDTFTFVAQDTTTKIGLRGSQGDANVAYDNISVQEAGPLGGWTGAQSTIPLAINNGRLKIEEDGGPNTARAYQQLSLEVGKTYIVTCDVFPDTATSSSGKVYVANGTSIIQEQIQGQSPTITADSVGEHFTFEAKTTNPRIILTASANLQSGDFVEYDNVSVKEAVADRSVNNNGLNIVGNVTKSAVATGAELMGYDGFATANHLKQDYNSDLDFGTGDFSFITWFKGSDSYGTFAGTNDALHDGFHIGVTGVEPTVNYRIFCGGTFTDTSDSSTIYSDTWVQLAVTRRGGVISVYENGRLIHTATNTGSITGGGALVVGYRQYDNAQNYQGKMSLLRISATAPTAEQIAKIYRDEKPLFQEGAKCTLSGTTDQVYALDYDEDMEILHVGTLNDRDEFKGLQRVKENDVEGTLTVAISAANGLVVEE